MAERRRLGVWIGSDSSRCVGSLSACPAHRLLSIKDSGPNHFYILNYNKSPLYLNLIALSLPCSSPLSVDISVELSHLSPPFFLYQPTLLSMWVLIPFDPICHKKKVVSWELLLLKAHRHLTLCKSMFGQKSWLGAGNMASYAMTFTLWCPWNVIQHRVCCRLEICYAPVFLLWRLKALLSNKPLFEPSVRSCPPLTRARWPDGQKYLIVLTPVNKPTIFKLTTWKQKCCRDCFAMEIPLSKDCSSDRRATWKSSFTMPKFFAMSRYASKTRLFPQPPILLFVSVCIKALQNKRDPH